MNRTQKGPYIRVESKPIASRLRIACLAPNNRAPISKSKSTPPALPPAATPRHALFPVKPPNPIFGAVAPSYLVPNTPRTSAFNKSNSPNPPWNLIRLRILEPYLHISGIELNRWICPAFSA